MAKVKKAIKDAIGDGVNSIVECMDVDGIVRRIEINELLQRVDFNAILESIDFDYHLERVDLNRVLERVDFDAIVQRLDVPAIVGKSDVGSIMVQSTTGVFTHVLDSLRTQVVVMDLTVLRIKKFKRWSATKGALPLAPGDPSELEYDECPQERVEKAVAVQGRYAGLFSRTLALFVDSAILIVSFACVILVVQLYWMLFVGDVSTQEFRSKVNKENVWAIVNREYAWAFILYSAYWFVYHFGSACLTGQTLGMGLAGIKYADSRTGLEMSGLQALFRTMILPFSMTFLPFLNFIGVVRRDERMLHDILTNTGCVYRWNARMAGLREKAERAEEEEEARRRQLERARRVSVRSSLSASGEKLEIEARLSEDSVGKKEQ